MPSISKEQQDYCTLTQLNYALEHGSKAIRNGPTVANLLQTVNVNLKVLSNKSGKNCLIGDTPLHVVCQEKHVKAFDVLLKRGADFTAKNENGRTAVHQAFYDMFSKSFIMDKITSGFNNAIIESALKAHVESGVIENPRSSDRLSHFHIACAANHLEAVQLFLDGGVSVTESVNADSSIFPGYAPLHFAVRFCDSATVKLLLERGANVFAKNSASLTPLHMVTEQIWELERRSRKNLVADFSKQVEESEKIIKLFLEDNRVIDVDEVGFSKLHAACTLSDSSLAERYLQDIDVNVAINVDSPVLPGYTGLHLAARVNSDIFKVLLKNGASIAAENANAETPFDFYMNKFDVDGLYNILSAIPAFKEILFSDNQTSLLDFIDAVRARSTFEVFLQSTPKDVYLPNDCPLWSGYGLSHLSVLFSQLKFRPVYVYLRIGGNQMTQDANGRTPIHLAFYQGKRSVIHQFFERQLGLVDAIDNLGLSHLHVACKQQNDNIVQTLLRAGANVNSIYKGKIMLISSKDLTPLHVAAVDEGNVEIVKMLLKHGADVNAVDAEGMTSMHRLIQRCSFFTENKTEIGDLLLSSSVLANVTCSKNGLTHLHLASYAGNVRAVERLLELGADPNAVFVCEKSKPLFCCYRCLSGYTPLHIAVANKNAKVVELLLDGGADVFHKKPDGMTLFYDLLCCNPHPNRIYRHKPVDIHTLKWDFMSKFINDMALRKQAENDSGLTMLHIACFLHDVGQIQDFLVDPEVNVNAQVHATSPIWPKATPLHLLIKSRYNIEDLKETVMLLLDHGADVTIMDNEGDTPVHTYWKIPNHKYDPGRHISHLLLRFQKDFSINPIDEEGISHFHLACAARYSLAVEKFLENGVDVNLPIDYYKKCMTFITPLLFTLKNESYRASDVDSRLKTIVVLLKYGADVNARDGIGVSPFLQAARCEHYRELYFQELQKAGAVMNCTNIYGHSALEVLFDTDADISDKELQFFVNKRNLFNTFNSVDGIGLTSKIIGKNLNRKLILEKIMNIPSLFAVDPMGRTPIHNLVANYCEHNYMDVELTYYTEKFVKMGYNIDAQDFAGQTALHYAANFHNENALSGLLFAGADINITDTDDQTFLDKLDDSLANFESQELLYRNRLIKDKIAKYILTMRQCSLEVNSVDLKWAKLQLCKFEVQFHRKTILKELKHTNSVIIGTGSLCLRRFLSETGIVACPWSIIGDDRAAVDKFFGAMDYKRFPELRGVLMLQYRKMLKRSSLVELATDSMHEILGSVNGFSMPVSCCRAILRFLSNAEVKNVIKSTSMSKN